MHGRVKVRRVEARYAPQWATKDWRAAVIVLISMALVSGLGVACACKCMDKKQHLADTTHFAVSPIRPRASSTSSSSILGKAYMRLGSIISLGSSGRGAGRQPSPLNELDAATRTHSTDPTTDLPAVIPVAAIDDMDVGGDMLVLEHLVAQGGFGSVYRGLWRNMEVRAVHAPCTLTLGPPRACLAPR